MTLTIDGHMRAYYRGYFQSTIHISPTVHGDGFRVACGPSGVDGVTGVGHVYDWILSARDSEGLETTSEGAVTCPALDPIHLRKTSEGPLGVGTTYQSLGRL